MLRYRHYLISRTIETLRLPSDLGYEFFVDGLCLVVRQALRLKLRVSSSLASFISIPTSAPLSHSGAHSRGLGMEMERCRQKSRGRHRVQEVSIVPTTPGHLQLKGIPLCCRLKPYSKPNRWKCYSIISSRCRAAYNIYTIYTPLDTCFYAATSSR